MSAWKLNPVAAPTKTTTSSYIQNRRRSQSQAGANNYKVEAARNAKAKTQPRHLRAPLASHLLRSQLTSISTKSNGDVCNADPQPNREVSVKPTPKLLEAIHSLGPESNPLQVKLVRRESEADEDTSSYESDSSGGTLSAGSPLRPNAKTNGRGGMDTNAAAGDNTSMIDLTSLLKKRKICLSQIPEAKVADPLDFPGIPVWFPIKIKRILKDDGYPDALPFKSVHKLTRYRGWLEARRRQRWRRYLKAGKCRWQLSNTLKKLREQPRSTAAGLYQRRAVQQKMWKDRAIRAMRKLDVIIGGINYLDESMAGIFETEREVYKKYLD